MRKLVSVQYVHHVTPIEGADNIECIHVLGWKCVAEKGEFSVGDLCVYFEVDSFLPICEQFEFLRNRSYKKDPLLGEGFRLKTQKIRGQISQGLVLPLTILPGDKTYAIGDDVTELLHVRKWLEEEKATGDGTIKGKLPYGIPKTDETRIQAMPKLLQEFSGLKYYITTKMDGSSMTMYWINGKFGICGRNYEYAESEKSSMWNYAKRIGIEKKLRESGLSNLAIQGEFCAPGIQKNRLGLKRPEWYVFTIIDMSTMKRLDLEKMQEICTLLELDMVPLEEVGEHFNYKSVDDLLERAKGKYPSGHHKEGIVLRPVEPVYSYKLQGPLSMKVINNDYLLKE